MQANMTDHLHYSNSMCVCCYTFSIQRDTQADTIAKDVPGSRLTVWIAVETPWTG